MKKKEIEKISQKLISSPKLVWDELDNKEKKKVFDFDKKYQNFLNSAKTEREAVNAVREIALKKGFSLKPTSFNPGKMLKTFQDKSIALSISGKRPIEEGINIIVSHLDSPRLDLKQNPLYEDVDLALIVEAIALVWLIGATFFLYHSLKLMELAAIAREKHGIGSSDIVYIDELDERPKMFVSKKYGLRGRPDYVLLSGDEHIPVEVKTGRNPKGPLFSHIQQTGTYCLLLEEEYGRAPPFGLLKYENSQHEIDYTSDMKKLVLNKLLEMRELMVTKNVHRNHNRKGKCIHCSRRDKCPEKLA